ncbi:YesL family protein [Micromonospora sp. WMMD964]|uniref:YesL family protein n=1 Tax=Micromonospora sp. WMMD964 TaxID=3016091 RepID=UPI00249B6571|nr:YesL family protein [Micromonospora sp. WMMD964]WFE99760.1 YesL family protein [Micromonospora sp. WMMD964]
MSGAAQTWRQFGDGPLSRISARVYILLVVELLLLLTAVPGLLPLLLLDRDPSNLPLVALLLVPVGPATSAALYALRHQRPDLTDLRPAATFWRGYRTNLSGALRVWTPTLLWLTVLAMNLAYRDAVGLPGWWTVPLVLLAVAVTLAAANALVITSLFDFRTRDVLRLAVHFLVRTPGVTVGTALLLAAATGVTAVFSEAVLVLLASVAALALLRVGDPMVELIRKEFTS